MRLRVAIVAVGLLAATAAAAGVGVRASRGGQVTGDEPQYLLTALSLAEDGDLDIADELRAQRWRAFHEAPLPEQTKPLPGGRRVSPHDPLLPLLLAAPTGLGGWVGAKLALAALAGLLAALTCWTAVRRFDVPAGVAAVVVGLFFASAPLAVYGTQVYPELPAALAVTAAAAALTAPLRGRSTAAVALAVIALPWLSVKYVPLAAAVAGVALARLRSRPRVAAAFTAALLLAGVVFLAAHQAWYGGWTAYASGDHFVGGEFTAVGTRPDLLGRSRRLLGLLVDDTFGLAAWQPAWLLVVPALALFLRDAPRRAAPVAVPLAVGWLVATFLALTMHGWWFPGRQVVAVLPLGVVAVAWWAARSRAALLGVAVLGAWGVWSYAWLLGAGIRGEVTWAVHFFDTPDPLYRLWRHALPRYLDVTPRTWALHAAWLVTLAAAALAAWRWTPAPPLRSLRARSRPGSRVRPGPRVGAGP